MLYNVSVTLSPALSNVHPWSDSTEYRGIGLVSSDCSSSVVHGSSEVLDENYEGLVEPPSSSDDGEIDIYIKPDMTEEQHSEGSHVTKFVSDEIHEEIVSLLYTYK